MAFRGSRGSKSITVQKEGYLHIKRNVSVLKHKEKSWQQKYVVLRKSYGDCTCLEWYENFEAFISHKNTTKLKLDGVDYIGPVDMGKDHNYAFVVFGGGQSQLQMSAKNNNERDEWIKALNQCVQNGKKSNPTSPKQQRSSSKTVYSVKLKDYTCMAGHDQFKDVSRDFTMIVGPEGIALITVDGRGDQKIVASWLLENIKSYESRPLEQNPSQKLLSIDTGRRSSTGQGTFNFYTPHGDQIKQLISQNTKRTYFKKMNSYDSFNMESNLYSSSPESVRSFSSPSQRSFSAPVPSPRRSTISQREGAIPFHKYDPPNRDSYAPYIEQRDGYVDIFTDPRKVEENRMRHSSRSSVSSCRSPNLNDSPRTSFECPETHDGYIQMLSESESASSYIDVLPDNMPDSSDHAYLDILSEESSSHYIEVIDDENSTATGSTISNDHPAYIDVIGDDEATGQSPRNISRGDSDEIYIDVNENRKQFESHEKHFASLERHFESREQHFELREQHFESREQHVESRGQHVESRGQHVESFKEHSSETQYEVSETNHVSHISTHREVHVTRNSASRDIIHDLRQTRESTASVSSSPRLQQSVTSQTSTEYSSLSSENDVFQERENSAVPEVFTDESAKSDDSPVKSEAVPSSTNVAPTGSDTLPMKSDIVTPKSGNNSPTKDYLTLNIPVLSTKPTLVASKSATLPAKNEGVSTDSEVDRRSAKARSWHNENENDIADNSENSSSTSESEHTRDSHDFSDDDTSDQTDSSSRDQFQSPKDQSGLDCRDRSRTEGDVFNLNSKGVDPSLLQAFQKSLTNPQQFSPAPSRHPPLTRETYTQDRVIFELENPIQGVSQRPKQDKKNGNAVEVKYICSNCGWHKRSKKRPSLKPSFRSKVCPQCENPITKQESKGPKNKEKGWLFGKLGKRRSSDEKIDKKDPGFMKPVPRTAVPQPSFLKNFRTTASELGLHSPKMDPKRSELGIAPSPLRALAAVSIEGEESTSCGKTPLATTVKDGGLANGISSPLRTLSPNPSKTLAPTPQGNYPLARSKSSPPLGTGGDQGLDTLVVDGQECEKIPRKNSGLTLPTLPEDEDPDCPTCLSPGTPPPMIPPRTRAPPVPPRQRNSPLANPRDENVHKLRRAQTDPTFSLAPSSPQVR